MKSKVLQDYLEELQKIINRGDAREESYYPALGEMLKNYAKEREKQSTDITILPKKTEAGNPDFRIWDGKNHITGYIEAKAPENNQLERISTSEQLTRYRNVFPNLILTNFYEFLLYQRGKFVCRATIAHATNAIHTGITPPLLKTDEIEHLLERFFSYKTAAIKDPETLAKELAKRTRFLKDEIISLEMQVENRKGHKVILAFYESFKQLLLNSLTEEEFADLYAQTLTYGIFAARTKADGEFNRELIYKHIPNTLGVLKSIFKYISYEEPPVSLKILIDDIADVLSSARIRDILQKYYGQGRGEDPIVHFYETFLGEYDPELREKRGVYYTPEPVVRYIVRAIHSILKSHFKLKDGFASKEVTLLDPAAGTLTFPAEAIRTAVKEHKTKYGAGGIHNLIKEHILPDFYAIELMMAPYTVGHLKISYLLSEYDYTLAEGERFKLFLSNTLEPDIPQMTAAPITHDISEECALANKVKLQDPILVIMGNPPYSGASENNNKWTEKLLKTDLDGAQGYYTIDGAPLDERNTKWLQDDYVKFLRFAQWKIHKAGKGIVGMITNHGYLDNPTFRGMRQSLMKTFDEIYVLDLHGNSLKKETCPDGSKDENVFDIRQGTAIVLMIKGGQARRRGISHHELFGLRTYKYDWLEETVFQPESYREIEPNSPFYLFKPGEKGNEHYLAWKSLPEIFPVNSVGIVTARDKVAIKDSPNVLMASVHNFAKCDLETAKSQYKLKSDKSIKKFQKIQRDLIGTGFRDEYIKPILYRPFDSKYTYYFGVTNSFIERNRYDVMRHMLKENIAIISNKREELNVKWSHIFITSYLSEHGALSSKTTSYHFPLYLYPDDHKEDIFARTEREYNIAPDIIRAFSEKWPQFEPEQLFYYVYAILHSNTYRERYAQYLKRDFPRIPIPGDYDTFKQLSELGRELADLHLLKSPLLDNPQVKYQGSGSSDMVEKVTYDPVARQVRINPHKYFEGLTPDIWNYHIGGYQVLHKYLKDRKGRTLEDPIRYCRIATALAQTIILQSLIDEKTKNWI